MNQTNRTPEILVPRLGDYLVELGKISKTQLQTALDLQKLIKQTIPAEQPPLVGQILVERGFISQEDLDIAVTDLIIKFKEALENSNQQLEKRVLERTRELELAIEKINELNNSKAEFVSNISHELCTPLTHIMGYTYLMLDGTFGTLSEDQKEALDAMKTAADKLEELITDLISFTDIENSELLIQPMPVSPIELCEQAVKSSRKLAFEKKIHLMMQCDKNLSKISADRDKILWVLKQFINNAIKFTAENGYILLRVKQLKETVEFSVIDTGIGIPLNKIQEIFEPFHQLDGSTTRKAGGTGIGLTISKEIIEAHHSKIDVHSEVGKGTEFRFRLQMSDLE